MIRIAAALGPPIPAELAAIPAFAANLKRCGASNCNCGWGTSQGHYQGYEALWLRFYDRRGQLILIAAEKARLRADKEKERADAAEAELARLRAELAQQKKNGGRP